jgi:hypothetical protein
MVDLLQNLFSFLGTNGKILFYKKLNKKKIESNYIIFTISEVICILLNYFFPFLLYLEVEKLN